MEFEELNTIVLLNKYRIEKIGYRSNLCYFERNKSLLNSIIKQIAINLNYIINKYDNLSTDELLIQLRKNCIKSFEKEFANNTRNVDAIIKYIQKNKRIEAKSKILYIHNQLWNYVNNNRVI